jgi:hypothetical protein
VPRSAGCCPPPATRRADRTCLRTSRPPLAADSPGQAPDLRIRLNRTRRSPSRSRSGSRRCPSRSTRAPRTGRCR